MPSKTNTELAKKISGKPANTVKTLLEKVEGGLEKRRDRFEVVLPEGYSADRFVASVYMMVANNNQLQQCTPASIVSGALEAAQMGLDFAIPNEVHLVKYGNTATLQTGFKGVLKMARRDKNVKSIDVNIVREKDVVEIDLGTEMRVVHKLPPFFEDRGETVGFYATAETVQGGFYTWAMSNDDVWAHAKKHPPKASKGPFGDIVAKGPKAKNWESYGFKTVALMLCNKKMDMSTDLGATFQREFDAERQAPSVVIEAQAEEDEFEDDPEASIYEYLEETGQVDE